MTGTNPVFRSLHNTPVILSLGVSRGWNCQSTKKNVLNFFFSDSRCYRGTYHRVTGTSWVGIWLVLPGRFQKRYRWWHYHRYGCYQGRKQRPSFLVRHQAGFVCHCANWRQRCLPRYSSWWQGRTQLRRWICQEDGWGSWKGQASYLRHDWLQPR